MRYSYDNLEMTVTYRKDKEIEIQVANHVPCREYYGNNRIRWKKTDRVYRENRGA